MNDPVNASLQENAILLSKEAAVERLLALIVTYSMVLVGTIGNSLVFAVYFCRFRSSSTRVFVMAVSVCDFAINVLVMPLDSILFWFMYSFFNDALCKIIIVTQKLFIITSGWILVFVAVDRRRRVCNPFKRQMTPRLAWILVFVSVCVACVCVFPFVPVYGVKSVNVKNINGKSCKVDPELVTYKAADDLVMAMCFLTGLTIITASYVHIACHVRKTTKKKTYPQIFLRKTREVAKDIQLLDLGRCNSSVSDYTYRCENIIDDFEVDGNILRSRTEVKNRRKVNRDDEGDAFVKTSNIIFLPFQSADEAHDKEVFPLTGTANPMTIQTILLGLETPESPASNTTSEDTFAEQSEESEDLDRSQYLTSSHISDFTLSTDIKSITSRPVSEHSKTRARAIRRLSRQRMKAKSDRALNRSHTTQIMFLLTVCLVVTFLPYIILV